MSDDASQEWDSLSELAQKVLLEKYFELPCPSTRMPDEGLDNDEKYLAYFERQELRRMHSLPSPVEEWEAVAPPAHLKKTAKWLRVSRLLRPHLRKSNCSDVPSKESDDGK